MNDNYQMKINLSEIDSLLIPFKLKLQKMNIIIEEDLLQQENEQILYCEENFSNIKRMTNEIEKFIENNMREMYKEILLIRKSYEDELIELMELDSGYNDIIDSIKEEMNSEEESIKIQYELSRMKGVELIIDKYKK